MTTTSTHPDSRNTAILAQHADLGVSRIVVTDLARARHLYETGLGLELLGIDGNVARYGNDQRVVLELEEQPSARTAGQHAGLFHVALLYPSRLELARVAQRLGAANLPLSGASDHGTHEAFYLRDADGNGLELAADRPRATWPRFEDFSHGPEPLDIEALMELVHGAPVTHRATTGVVVGHLHLHVGDIDEALAFYRDVVGFELQARMPTAGFVSVGGYHHHLGFNVWNGVGVGAAPSDAVGIRYWTVLVPEQANINDLAARLDASGIEYELRDGVLAVRDPWQSELRVQLAG